MLKLFDKSWIAVVPFENCVLQFCTGVLNELAYKISHFYVSFFVLPFLIKFYRFHSLKNKEFTVNNKDNYGCLHINK